MKYKAMKYKAKRLRRFDIVRLAPSAWVKLYDRDTYDRVAAGNLIFQSTPVVRHPDLSQLAAVFRFVLFVRLCRAQMRLTS